MAPVKAPGKGRSAAPKKGGGGGRSNKPQAAPAKSKSTGVRKGKGQGGKDKRTKYDVYEDSEEEAPVVRTDGVRYLIVHACTRPWTHMAFLVLTCLAFMAS